MQNLQNRSLPPCFVSFCWITSPELRQVSVEGKREPQHHESYSVRNTEWQIWTAPSDCFLTSCLLTEDPLSLSIPIFQKIDISLLTPTKVMISTFNSLPKRARSFGEGVPIIVPETEDGQMGLSLVRIFDPSPTEISTEPDPNPNPTKEVLQLEITDPAEKAKYHWDQETGILYRIQFTYHDENKDRLKSQFWEIHLESFFISLSSEHPCPLSHNFHHTTSNSVARFALPSIIASRTLHGLHLRLEFDVASSRAWLWCYEFDSIWEYSWGEEENRDNRDKRQAVKECYSICPPKFEVGAMEVPMEEVRIQPQFVFDGSANSVVVIISKCVTFVNLETKQITFYSMEKAGYKRDNVSFIPQNLADLAFPFNLISPLSSKASSNRKPFTFLVRTLDEKMIELHRMEELGEEKIFRIRSLIEIPTVPGVGCMDFGFHDEFLFLTLRKKNNDSRWKIVFVFFRFRDLLLAEVWKKKGGISE